ncbi:MAG: hypothetical protein RL417_2581 [Pseudomonadota bacterium]|jgi:hypothetical protein
MSIVDTINAVHERLTGRKRIVAAIIVVVVLSYLGVIVALVGLLSSYLAWFVGLAGAIFGGYLGWKRGIFSTPSLEEASSLIDSKFETKDRALTLAATWEESTEPQKAILQSQLEKIVPELDTKAAIPLDLPPKLRTAVYTLPVIWGVLFFLNGGGANKAPAQSQAELITELLEQRADIPLPVRESLIELKDTLETKPLTDTAVIEALRAAQAELDAAQGENAADEADSSHETVDESEVGEGSNDGELSAESPRDIAPVDRNATPTPEPTPTANAPVTETPVENSPQQEEEKEEKRSAEQSSAEEEKESGRTPEDTDVQNSKPSEEQGGADKKSTDSQNDGGEGKKGDKQQQSGGQSGQSEGEAGKDESQQGQDGDGDGNSSSKEGKQPGQSGGKSGNQGESGQQGTGGKSGKEGKKGEKEGAQGGQGGAGSKQGSQSESPNGLEQAQQTLDQIEQQLKAEQQGKEKGSQEGENEGADKGDKGESSSGSPSGTGGEKHGASEKKSGSGQGSDKKPGKDPADKDKSKQDSPGSSGGKGGQSGSPKERSSPSGGDPADNEPREEFGDPPKLPTGSSVPKESDAAMGQGDETGGLGSGLGERKGFKDTEIKTGDEKYDSRFMGADGKVGLNKGPARAKTRLEDVKLAKPDPVKDPAEQPIPLEYRDILE